MLSPNFYKLFAEIGDCVALNYSWGGTITPKKESGKYYADLISVRGYKDADGCKRGKAKFYFVLCDTIEEVCQDNSRKEYAISSQTGFADSVFDLLTATIKKQGEFIPKQSELAINAGLTLCAENPSFSLNWANKGKNIIGIINMTVEFNWNVCCNYLIDKE